MTKGNNISVDERRLQNGEENGAVDAEKDEEEEKLFGGAKFVVERDREEKD